MSPELATVHGVPFVHLAVFAIDIDRIHAEVADDDDWPFGWEVYLTEHYVLHRMDVDDATRRALLEATLASILDRRGGDSPLGSQLTFAVYDAVTRGQLPTELRSAFKGWRKGPRALLASLRILHERGDEALEAIVDRCLTYDLDPPVAGPTRSALESMGRR